MTKLISYPIGNPAQAPEIAPRVETPGPLTVTATCQVS